jgi:hypothetical protein
MAPNAGGALASLGNMITRTTKNDTPAFSGGIVGRLGAVTKLERRAAANRSTARGDLNLARIAKMNGGALSTQVYAAPGSRLPAVRNPATGRFMQNPANFSTQTTALGSMVNKAVANETLSVGERRAMTAAGVKGTVSRSFMEYAFMSGGGLDFMSSQALGATAKTFGTGTLALTDSAEQVVRGLAKGIHANGQFGVNVANKLGMAMPMTELGAAKMGQRLLGEGIYKTLGARGTLQAVKAGGAKVGMAVGARAVAAAVPGLNLIFAADMAYQLAKLGGLAVKAGINFGKDGMKSMQGNMNSGIFGSGYKDDEVRATSRARGVAAIQNSRLNARSLLGSEGAMMASHFG